MSGSCGTRSKTPYPTTQRPRPPRTHSMDATGPGLADIVLEGEEAAIRYIRDEGPFSQADLTRALYEAAGQASTAVVEALLEAGAPVDRGDDLIPLSNAIRGGRYETVRLLLERGADINLRADGSTPIEEAIRVKSAPMVELLLTHGRAMPSTLHRAYESGSADVLGAVLAASRHVDFRDTYGHDIIQNAIKDRNPLLGQILEAARGQIRASPMYVLLAAETGNREAGRLLAEYGFLRGADGRDLPVLVLAMRTERARDAQDMLQFLLELGLDPNGPTGSRPPLFAAAARRIPSAVPVLAAEGADLRINYEGRTAMDVAITKRAPGVVQALLDAGYPPNMPNAAEDVPLMTAIRENEDAMQPFLDAGANPEGGGGVETPLFYAVRTYRGGAVEILLRAGARHTRLVGGAHAYAIAWAANPAIAKLLVDAGSPTRRQAVALMALTETLPDRVIPDYTRSSRQAPTRRQREVMLAMAQKRAAGVTPEHTLPGESQAAYAARLRGALQTMHDVVSHSERLPPEMLLQVHAVARQFPEAYLVFVEETLAQYPPHEPRWTRKRKRLQSKPGTVQGAFARVTLVSAGAEHLWKTL